MLFLAKHKFLNCHNKEDNTMTKEQLMALKPEPKTTKHSMYDPPEVSVEAKRVVITHHDKQKKEAKMD